MLDLSTAVLCDFAQVRDRLLFVSSGAVSRLYRQELPSPLGLMVGLVIEVPLEDAGMEHKLRAEVINRHGTVLATLENLFRVGDVGLFPHEVQQVPLVLSITGVRARTWGTHQVRLYLDDDLVRALTLYVVPAAGPQAVVRAAPTQSRVADDEGSLGGTGTDGVEGAEEGVPGEAPAAEETIDEGAEPAPAVPWGSTGEEPAPGADEAPEESHQIVIELDQPEDGPVTIEPEPAAVAPTVAPAPAPAPAPAEAIAPPPEPEPTPEPRREPTPQPDREPEPAAPAWGREPTIDAPAAPEPVEAAEPPQWRAPSTPTPPPPSRVAEPATQSFDFDEDDLDADPANRPAPDPNERSRFSFRYRYDDGEDAPT